MSYNHTTMNSHDSRRRPSHSRKRSRTVLCVLAATLAPTAVTAFGVSSTAAPKRSNSALESAPAIPMPLPTSSASGLELPSFTFPDMEVPQKKLKTKTRSSSSSKLPRSSSTTQLPTHLRLDESEIVRRKQEWAGRYTSLEALRETFGSNENKLWGDLQASTARRLYKTLLPRALLDLSQLGLSEMQPHDLAPLAYEARVAAKLYARERCTVPARIAATLFDGFRQFTKYGTWQGQGMTYDQIWNKYSETLLLGDAPTTSSSVSCEKDDSTTTVCLKILEKSCVSNSGVDRMVSVPHDYRVTQKTTRSATTTTRRSADAVPQQRRQQHEQELLERIHAQLEQDMYQLLLPNTTDDDDDETTLSSIPLHRQERHAPSPSRKLRRNNDHVRLVRLLAKQRRLQQRREALGMDVTVEPSDASAVLRP